MSVRMGLHAFAAVVVIAGSAGVCAYAADQDARVPSVTIDVKPKTVTIGDPMRVTLRIQTAKGTSIQLPAAPEKMGDFTVRDSGSAERGWGRAKTVTVWYELSVFSAGKHTIPGVKIEYKPRGSEQWRSFETPQNSVDVVSLLEKEGDAARLRDIEGPLGARRSLRLYMILAAVVFFGILIAALMMRKRRARQAAAALRELAHVTALRELKDLQFKNLIAQGLVKEYFTSISDIIRRYIENRFDLHAPEMTTEEFLARARESQALISSHSMLLRDFLACCDLVKFAKYLPQEKETDAAFAAAYDFVERTQEVTAL